MFCYVYFLLCLCFVCSFVFKGWQTVISRSSDRGWERNKEYAICKHSRKRSIRRYVLRGNHSLGSNAICLFCLWFVMVMFCHVYVLLCYVLLCFCYVILMFLYIPVFVMFMFLYVYDCFVYDSVCLCLLCVCFVMFMFWYVYVSLSFWFVMFMFCYVYVVLLLLFC